MSFNNSLTDPESIRANQSGQLTKDQTSSLKNKLGGLPGWFLVILLFALIGATAVVGGKILQKSTPLAIAALVGDILVTFAITSFLGGLLANLRMTKIAVEQAPGQIIWNNNQYTAITGGRMLDPITGGLNLQPGDYTFYLLRGTKYLLSAQPAAWTTDFDGGAPAAAAPAPMDFNTFKALVDQPVDFDPRQEPEKAAQRLAQLKQAAQAMEISNPGINQSEAVELSRRMSAQMRGLMQGLSIQNLAQIGRMAEVAAQPKLDYQGVMQLNSALEQSGVRDVQAMNANHVGKQSAGQRFRLIKEVSSNLFWVGVIGIGWLVISYMFLTKKDWTGLLAVTGFFLLVVLMLLSSVRKEMFDLMSGSVQMEEGQVTKYSRSSQGRSSHTMYFYQINQYHLQVGTRAYNALIQGNYRLYFLPNTKDLVNIEPLS